MKRVSLAEAKTRLSALVARAAEGEAVCITRRGRPIAQITMVVPARKPIDPSALAALTSAMPLPPKQAPDLVRRMRDEDRY